MTRSTPPDTRHPRQRQRYCTHRTGGGADIMALPVELPPPTYSGARPPRRSPSRGPASLQRLARMFCRRV